MFPGIDTWPWENESERLGLSVPRSFYPFWLCNTDRMVRFCFHVPGFIYVLRIKMRSIPWHAVSAACFVPSTDVRCHAAIRKMLAVTVDASTGRGSAVYHVQMVWLLERDCHFCVTGVKFVAGEFLIHFIYIFFLPRIIFAVICQAYEFILDVVAGGTLFAVWRRATCWPVIAIEGGFFHLKRPQKKN